MLKLVPAPDHVIALQLSGKLTGEDIQKYHHILEGKLQQHAQIGIFVDLTGLADMTAKALIEGTKADLHLFRHIKQLNRCAFVADKEWPQTVVACAQQIFPILDLKVFPVAQHEQALQWAAHLHDRPLTTHPAIRFLPTPTANVLAFEIDGLITSEEMPEALKVFEEFFAGHDQVRLLNRMKHFGGFDPTILLQSRLIAMKLSAMRKLERYAIVGAPSWMVTLIAAISPAFADIEMRTFAAEQEDEAWAWLEAEPAE